ncbi:MAG TPA: BamA/TamA family outer membrane protein [Polyangia bacterium]|nr:BamA/TamA family outer membrane protein [Polyangia bacterium]
MRTAIVVALLLGAGARTVDAAAPPDVVHGERYDGRPRPSRAARQALLAVPRALLAVPRLLVRGLAAAGRPVMEWNERHHVMERVNDALTSKDGLVGVRPELDWQLASKPSFGVLYFDNRHGVKLSLSGASGGPDVVLARAHAASTVARAVALDFDLRYKRRSDEFFSGIGMQKLPYARYGVDQVDATVGFSGAPVRHVAIDAGAGFGLRRFNDGLAYAGDDSIDRVYCERGAGGHCYSGRVDERLVPGFAAGTQFIRESLAVHVDSRRDPDSPGSGARLDLGIQYSQGFAGDRSSYLRYDGRLGGALELWRHRLLYVGLAAVDEVNLGAQAIPFSELVTLGGADDLRGFRLGQFRDHSSLLGTIEYRWPVWMWMDGTVFADYGGVFDAQFRNFSFSKLRPDVGVGVRMVAAPKFAVRVQLAYGFGDDGGFRLVIAGNANPR